MKRRINQAASTVNKQTGFDLPPYGQWSTQGSTVYYHNNEAKRTQTVPQVKAFRGI
jgi:hypothetical protein